jgi:hypothetical protein
MSLRIDTSEWISGALIIGETGLGVLDSAIPSAGDNGAGYAYNDLSLPADAGKEICGRITTWPTAGTLTVNEDTSFSFDAPDGAYTAQYQLYVDGVSTGSPQTISLIVGAGNVLPGVGVLSITGYQPTVAQGAAHAAAPGAGTLTVNGYAPTVAQPHAALPGVGSLSVTGYAPSVVQFAGQVTFPQPGQLSIAGYAPSVLQTGPRAAFPGAASLMLTTYAPTVMQSSPYVSASRTLGIAAENRVLTIRAESR